MPLDSGHCPSQHTVQDHDAELALQLKGVTNLVGECIHKARKERVEANKI